MKTLCAKSLNLFLFVLLTLTTLFSCTLEASAVTGASEREMSSRVARIIDEQMSMIAGSDEIMSSLSEEERTAVESGASGEDIVSRALTESQGEEYLTFSYTAVTSQDPGEILQSAKSLLPDEEYRELQGEVSELQTRSRAFAMQHARTMTTEQQKKFYQELQGLVVKAVVLLTAAVVYACIPKVVVWGKVSAACVAAVAAGILASGIMTFVGYQRYGGGEDFDFVDWLSGVYKDAFAEWAIASSMITTGTAASRSPVMIAIIIAAFALYDVFDEAKAMYKIATQ